MTARVLMVPIMVATMLASAFAATQGWTIAAIVGAVLVGIAALVALIDDLVLGFGALFLLVTAGIMASSIDTPLIGGTVRGIRIAEAPAHPAATYHFTDGHVLRSAARWVPIHGGTKGTHHELYRLGIAPIVGEDWTPDRPVAAWAVTSPPSAGLPGGTWALDARAGVRAIGHVHELQAAIPAIEQGFGLRSAPDAPLIHWLADPEAAMMVERWHLVTVGAVLVGLWGVLVLIRRRSGAPSRRAVR